MLDETEFKAVREAVIKAAPPGMTEDEYYRYIGPKFAEAIAVAENSPKPVEGSAVGRFVSGAAEMLNPVAAVSGLYNTIRHPIDTVSGMVSQAGQQFGQAKDLYQQGRYVEAAGHAAAGAIPLVGPAAAGIGEQIAGGDTAGGLGKAAGLIATPRATGAAVKAVGKVLPAGPLVRSKLNPAEAAAVDFGKERGVPLDLATATGSKTARAMQKRAANSIGGEGQAERMITAQEQALTRVGRELTEQANRGSFVTPEQAGAGAKEGVTSLVSTMNDVANEAYGKLRKIEDNPAHMEYVHSAPAGSRSYKALSKKLSIDGADPTHEQLFGLRQIEAELEATPFSKKQFRQVDQGKGNSWEHIEGVGGAGAPVYHDVLKAMDGAEVTRGAMQAAIKQTLETGEWNNVSRGALGVVKDRLKDPGFSGPSLTPDAPILGGTERVQLPVALSGVKKALEPLYDRLKRESELVPLMGDKGRALVALDRLLTGPEHAPVSVVDAALGDLKSMARADIPELRTQGQGLAALAVKSLDKAVKEAAAKAGPEALSALEEGRAATVAKYQAGDVLKQLTEEPVKVFRQMTAPKDSGIALLRQVNEMAPGKMPDVARAYLEDLMGTATAEGGFGRSAKLQAEWQKLGTETKRTLFPDASHVDALDKFFLLAKRLAENPNPSGTAHVNNVFNWMSTVGTYPLSKILYTERGVKAMTTAYQLSLSPAKATRAVQGAIASSLARAARAGGVDLSAVPMPATADREEPAETR